MSEPFARIIRFALVIRIIHKRPATLDELQAFYAQATQKIENVNGSKCFQMTDSTLSVPFLTALFCACTAKAVESCTSDNDPNGQRDNHD
ncbi:MAG: hypothetical protein H6695_14600 [Deferribacteres bacterium]|nr:hypothetical protein [candidate division KSB1 bacterium]MCB9511415.1 hypothetical protein [Deferribacteres bacterium]